MSATYFAKVVDGIVIDLHVVSYEFIVANPERYGDATLWIETFVDGSGPGYCGIGWTYDAALNKFTAPVVEDAPL